MQLVPKTVPLTASNSTLATKKITLDVGSMKCGGCVKTVERLILQQPGAIAACVNLVTEVAVVECQADTDPLEIAAKLTNAGYPTKPRFAQVPHLEEESTLALEDPQQKQQREMRSARRQIITSAVLLILSSLGHLPESLLGFALLKNIWLHWGLATITLLLPGREIILDGWRGLKRNAPNMNTLVALGTLTAYTTSVVALLFPQLGWECFFDEPVMLLGFILLGRTLEQQARGKAAAAFKRLLALQPQVARLIAQPQGEFAVSDRQSSVEIPADRVRVGEWLQVLPGEKIPVDGEVVAGQTTVDESMLTGEAMPQVKQSGDVVTAGTLNKSGAIALRATRTGSDTTLAQIVDLVEAAQTRKAPVQKLADTVAGYFTYGVLAAALLTFLFWYFIGTHIWTDVLTIAHPAMSEHASLHTQHLANAQILAPSPLLLSLKLAISVMVVACPCAMGLATPTAILVGTGVGAEQGLLIKGGDVLERVHQLDTVVFDKTGTLTSGHPTVTDCILVADDVLPSDLLQIAAAVESGTSHPLAAAIVQAAQKQNLSIPAAKDFYTEPGLGVSAQLKDGVTVLVGNAQWLSQNAVNISDTASLQAQTLAATGKTVVFVATGDCLIGLIAASDTLRADASQVVESLRAGLGLKVMLLTGDKLTAAKAVAAQLGISDEDIIADIRPAGKAAAIQQLQAQQQRVAMVGDGINDAPALSQADVGIALKAGTDVAMEAAQIVLMRDRLTDVVAAIELSKATFQKIRQNLFWAFAYNTLGIPIAAGVLLPSLDFVLSPAAAGALMAFSSVSVVTNSLLLRRFK
ncbi:heavy metal translocating P-type ATPase [Aliterella atlantica]|uniref:ATPase n=1 Tax=Aliterella atlantica CENA595 TaxID=1618023 RepID=A0A0D9A011_9CYAN|nr:heavy metal translocating P-type ATPase [Aliterella atlantica]KJH72796.1 ATPase [Aliterella atlantica CENA595]